MPTPSIVKINGVELNDVMSVEFYYETPTDGGYLRNVRPQLGRIEIVRRATAHPTVALFDLATNEDGAVKIFGGSFTIVDAQDQELYSVTFGDAFMEAWSMAQPEADARGTETVVLRAASIQFFAGRANQQVNIRKYGQ